MSTSTVAPGKVFSRAILLSPPPKERVRGLCYQVDVIILHGHMTVKRGQWIFKVQNKALLLAMK